MVNIVAIVPIKHNSSRVPGKNRRSFNGQPLYTVILETLLSVPAITTIVVNTDCPIVKAGIQKLYPDIKIYDRPTKLLGDTVSTNLLLLDTINSLSLDDETIILQTHVTNPLLTNKTITKAIRTFNDNSNDSLFGVNVHHTRLYDKDRNAMNHDVMNLIPTQDLDPIFEENSCIYIFQAKMLRERGIRIGNDPYLFPIDRQESQDIDWEDDFILARLLLQLRERKNKVVLVTGSSGGIGTSICKIFHEDGWIVLAVDKIESKHDHHTTSFVVDITDRSKIEEMVDAINELYGGLDCLVNNAGYQVCQPLNTTSEQEWDDVMGVNLRAPFILSKLFHPLLKKKKGSIVNISSIHSMTTSKGIAGYSVSKAGLSGLTRTMALEYAPDGIRVNAVVPGAISTPMLREHLTEYELRIMGLKHPLQKIGDPDEVAEVVYFLADRKSSFITGQNLVVDGGVSICLSTEV